jgi:uncharacterized protein
MFLIRFTLACLLAAQSRLFATECAHALLFADRSMISTALERERTEISNLNFTNLWGWHPTRNYWVRELDEAVLVSVNSDTSQITYLEPYGVPAMERAKIIAQTLETSQGGGTPQRFIYVSSEVAEILRGDPENPLEITSDSNGFDYVYDKGDLIRKEGSGYQGYRRKLNRFHREHPNAKFVSFDESPSLIEQAAEFSSEWLTQHSLTDDPTLQNEVRAANRVLAHYFDLDLLGGAIVINDQVAAYGIGELINSNTIVIHFIKGSSAVSDIDSAILDSMVTHSPARALYINLEEDLGYQGLKRHKESLRPCKRVHKYIVRVKDTR